MRRRIIYKWFDSIDIHTLTSNFEGFKKALMSGSDSLKNDLEKKFDKVL